MSEIGHIVRETLTLANRTNSAFGAMGTSPANRILGSELDGSSEYILIVRCGFGGSSNTVNTFEMQVEEDGVGTLAESNSRSEPRASTNQQGIHFGFLDKVTTASTPNNYQIEAKSDGTETVRVNGSWLAMLKLDDLDAADWAYAANDTDDTTLTTTFEDGASITLSAGDWDIYAFARFDDNSTGRYFLARMDVDGTVKAEIRQQGEDVTNRRCLLMKTTVNIPSGTPTAKVQYALDSGTTHDLLSTRIFAIRLDAFEDHAFKNKAKGVSETVFSNDDIRFNVDTLTYTSDTAATRTWFVSAAVTHDVESNQARTLIAVQNTSNVDFIGVVNVTAGNDRPENVTAGNADENSIIIFGELTGHADATDLDLELDVMDHDDPGNGAIDESSISAFTWELAVVIGPISAALPIALGVTADLKAKGKLDAALATVYSVTADLKAKGKLDAVLPFTVSVVADLKGSGKLDAALPISFGTVADLKGRGKLDAALNFLFNVVADLKAQGKLDSTLPVSFGVAANLQAIGKLDAALPISLDVVANLQAIGKLDAALSVLFNVVADLKATGKLDAALAFVFNVVADLQDASGGQISAVLPMAFSVAADLKAQGKLDAALPMSFAVAANLQAIGKLDAALSVLFNVVADLKAQGKLDATLATVFAVAADLKAQGKLDAALAMVFNVVADLQDASSGAISAVLPMSLSVAANLKAIGRLDASLPIAFSVIADLKAIGKLDAALPIVFAISADLQAQGKLDAALPMFFSVLADLKARGQLSANLAIAFGIAANLRATGQLDASANIAFSIIANLIDVTLPVSILSEIDLIGRTIALELEGRELTAQLEGRRLV